MAITKAMGATTTDVPKYVSGPTSSVKRLEQALKSGNAEQAKRALETVKQNLPVGLDSAKELAKAVTALDRALESGDISKANEALNGVKEQASKLEVDTNERRQAQLDEQKSTASQAVGPTAAGVLDIKA